MLTLMGTIIIKGEGTVEEKEPEKQSFRVSRDKERSAPKEAEKKTRKGMSLRWNNLHIQLP
jgi:hypothetical protein